MSQPEGEPESQSESQSEAAELAAGQTLFRAPCEFLLGVVAPDGLPEPRVLEVAFAGRSNVGKSSLLNALVGRKALARTSNTPGRTREINYFTLGLETYLVDLPGYGYAKAPKTAVADWNQLIEDYLKGRAALRRVFLLIDARHGLKATDAPALELMDVSAVSYQAVLTKADKVGEGPLEKVRDETAKALATHPAAHPDVLATSSHKRTGLAELKGAIATLLSE